MIPPDAVLSIQLIPLYCIQIREYQVRDEVKLCTYIQLLREHPGHYLGLLSVEPSDTHPGMFCLLDGHKRYCSYIIDGRSDAFCVVIEERSKEARHDRH